jgi:hypothetical protein
MNARERFVKTLTGEKVDRVPFMKAFGGTNAALPDWEAEYPGLRQCIDELLGFEGDYRGWGTTDVFMDPTGWHDGETVAETAETITIRRGEGTLERRYKGGGDYRRHTIDWPVKDMRSWQEYKAKFLDPDEPSRFPKDWSERVKEYKVRDYPLQLTHRGVYGFARERMGDENLAYAFYDQPEMVHDMMESYTDMAIRVWEKQVADVDFDLIECWEDMASKNGCLISPAMFREFMTPCYQRIAAFAKDHGIRVILVDSDGLIEELTGLMLEAGVTAMYPYEVLAGNDVARVLDRYPTVGAIGGLRKESMYEGKAAIDAEMEKARMLIKKGRFIPGPDHFVLSYASFANYRYFMERLREVVMTTEPGT